MTDQLTKGDSHTSYARPSLGMGRGTAMYIGAILGPGILALPGLAAAEAGPASIVTWIVLLGLSVPVALSFAALAAKFPDAGGVATFVRRAFGARPAGIVGWWFYCVIPIGAWTAGIIGAEYVGEALGLGGTGKLLIGLGLLAAAFGANHLGLRLSGGTQLLLMIVLVLLLGVATVAGALHVSAANLTPFAPHGVAGIVSAAGVLFYAFAGWEAASHLSGEFTDPARQLRRVTGYTLLIVSVLYIGLSIVTVGALGGDAATSPVALTALLTYALGPAAAPVTAIIALVLSFGALNTFVAGASRLGAALARDGDLPAVLARGGRPGEIPHRSLLLLGSLTAVATTVSITFSFNLDDLMRATSACLAAVTVLGCAAAVRLLRGRSARAMAIAATGFTTVVLASMAWYLLVPLGIAALALGYRWTRRERPTH
ncbi:APC family permease [Stackebrandtia nassauensis]|uniref:Amino acid permease-associated region n=1 Tax=Stackebrandtia nassauensis (strain DSM 44728 / CIP 108903 / NRRL B-16338 / NBRC 102104 / LLR-40K-21) TaxID=446470 RepID=D3Q3Q6_STANL|nr:amino acid permease [Stackebrandtia nassauensis]ADD43973.1 amino acid permease-associated region [Stackebrandtia nassauensis DSM 44728]